MKRPQKSLEGVIEAGRNRYMDEPVDLRNSQEVMAAGKGPD